MGHTSYITCRPREDPQCSWGVYEPTRTCPGANPLAAAREVECLPHSELWQMVVFLRVENIVLGLKMLKLQYLANAISAASEYYDQYAFAPAQCRRMLSAAGTR